ncbi:MAG: DsrE family protein [Candidatus Nezhaarchaeota archaeon]|nr:DsrE family protein [Candidatus Nezhaarchaeota archaeon]
MKIAIKILVGPYTFQHSEVALRIAEKALEVGAKVVIFLYLDGVHCAKRGQSPREFTNIEGKIEELKHRGAEVAVCLRCAAARGYGERDVAEGVGMMPLNEFASQVKDADVVMVVK